MKGVVIWLLVFFGSALYAQHEIDSLENLLNNADTDEERLVVISELIDLYGTLPEAELYVKSLLDLGEKSGGEIKIDALRKAGNFYLNSENPQKGINFWYKAIVWGQKNELTNVFDVHMDLGKYYQKKFMLDSSIYYYQLAEEGFEKNKSFEDLANVLNREGVLLKNVENYGEALEKYYKAYDIAKEHGLDKNEASACLNIGVVFKKQDLFEDAMEYYKKAEDKYLELQDHLGLANVYNNMGNVYRIQDEFDLALTNYKKAIKNRKIGGSDKTLSYSYNNIALVYKEKLQFDSTLHYLKLSEDYKLKLEEFSSLSSTYLNFADTYVSLDDSINFEKYIKLTKEYALKYQQYPLIEEMNILYSKYAADKGNYEKAYDLLVSVIQQMDTLSTKEQKVLSQVLQAQYKDKQKEELIIELQKSLNEKDDLTKQLKNDESNLSLLVVFLVFVFLLLAVALILMFRSFRRLKNGAEEYERINEELRATRLGAEEKDMMIKEIHHRVKNNLQVVKSLIRLQREAAEDSGCGVLTDFENRVSSIALVHESLHGSIDLTKVDVQDYYRKLIKDLIDVYSLEQEITSTIQVDELSFGLDTLIPLGLLTNEIVSNALKHGFKGKEYGHLEVSLKYLSQDEYELKISDDGVGIAEDYLSRNSLGLELIDTLVGQLDGTKNLVVENGTKYIIKFKNQDKIR